MGGQVRVGDNKIDLKKTLYVIHIMPYNKYTNFANAIIYTITKGEDIYVGSTTNLKQRISNHKWLSNNDKSIKLYDAIRASGGWDNWEIKEYEKFPCSNYRELLKREDEVRILLNASLNMVSCSFAENRQKYREARREELRQKQREYVAENREQVRAKQKEKVECDICKSLYSKSNLAKHKKTHTIVL